MQKRPSILLTNWMLSGRSGMELYIHDLALGLKRRGWNPSIFSLQTGPLAEELRAAGVPVLTRVDELPPDIEIVHGHHNFMTMAALLACRGARGLFVCHTSICWQEEARLFPRILSWVGVDDLCRERVARDLGIPLETVRFIGNSVDLERFTPRAPLPAKPRRALLFSNYAAEHTFLPTVRAACQQEGIQLDVIGSGVLNQVSDPERALQDYDLVFAKARCAMESLATGCATVLCGTEGCGPLVTMENFDRLRRDNFGRRCLSQTMTVENLVASMRRYDATACGAVMRHARAQLNLENILDQWEALYEEVMGLPCPADPEEEARAAASLLTRLAAPLFQTFELESARDFLQSEASRLTEVQYRLQDQLDHAKSSSEAHQNESRKLTAAHLVLKDQLKHLREREGRHREKADSLRARVRRMQHERDQCVRLKAPLAWLWRYRLLRPIARALGIRVLLGAPQEGGSGEE